jgi:integrase
MGAVMAARRELIGAGTAASIKPGEIVWDTKIPGFCARRQRVCVSYSLKTRLAGRIRWIPLGRDGAVTAATARKNAKDALAKRQLGGDPLEGRMARAKPDVANFAQRWLAEHVSVKRKPRTRIEYQRIVDRHITDSKIGRTRLDLVKRADVIEWHSALHEVGATAANRYLQALSAIFGFAEKVDLIPIGSNPCRRVEKFRELPRKRSVAVAELQRLWRTLDEVESEGNENPFALAAIRLLMLTGARKSDILEALWCNVDTQRRVLSLDDSKTGRRRVDVGLNRAAIDVIAKLPRVAGNPYLIVGEKPGQHLVNIQKPWARIRTRAGLADVRLHDLRHGVASLLAKKVPLIVVRDQLGHTTTQTTDRYSHAEADAVSISVEQIATLIGISLASDD